MFQEINTNVIKILGLDNLSVEEQKDAMEKMGALVYQEVMLRVLDIMSDSLRIGTANKLAAIHQRGTRDGRIPARPMAELSENAKRRAMKCLQTWIVAGRVEHL